MSEEFTGTLDAIDDPIIAEKKPAPHYEKEIIDHTGNIFDIVEFSEELRKASEESNAKNYQYSNNITAYSIAHDCVLKTVKKILDYPVQSFADAWLPLKMRSVIGSAIHDFIQNNTNQFSEIEVVTKAPSIRFSGRIDGLIGNNILVELKSCTYDDYRKILKQQFPREGDLYQVLIYKYILEKYIDELRDKTKQKEAYHNRLPKLEKYDIKKLQFIYIAHDIYAATVDDFGEALKRIKDFKKTLKSGQNKFFFITSIVIDVDELDINKYFTYIQRKIEAINQYVDTKTLPLKNDEFMNENCFFCYFKHNCESKK